MGMVIYKYDEFDLINEAMLNESFDFEAIKEKVMKFGNLNKLASIVVNKLNYEIKNFTIRRNLLRILIAICIINLSLRQNSVSPEKLRAIENSVSVYDESLYHENKKISTADVTKIITEHIPFMTFSGYKHGYKFSLSDEGLELIKSHEDLKLVAYSLGDGKITVGWGHAETIGESKYDEGERISLSTAEKLLEEDIAEAEDGVKRIFKEWERKNIHIKITQSMYDAMVSMAFNMGIGGFRNTVFIQYVKRNNLAKAAEVIKVTKLKKNYAGLKARRMAEYEHFIQDMISKS